MSFNQNSTWGNAVFSMLGAQLGTFGNVFVVVNPNDTAELQYQMLQDLITPDTNGLRRLYSSIADAYAAVQDGNNDVILLAAGTSNKVTSMLTVAKNKVHFFGMDGGGRKIGSRCLISNTGTGATTDVAMVRVTGRGCSFHNIKFSNNWTVAENLFAVQDRSNNAYFENCDIEAIGSAHLTNANAASLNLSAGESIYKNCTIGQDTLLVTSTGGQQVLIDRLTGAGQAATRCMFEDCNFQAYSSDTTHVFVRVVGTTSVDRYNNFNRCTFQNTGTTTGSGVEMAVAMATPSGMSGQINVYYPAIVGATKLGSSAIGNTGLFVVSPAIVATAVVGLQTT